MFFKKKCNSCGTKNPTNATVCASCGAPFGKKPAEGQTDIKDEPMPQQPQDARAYYERGETYYDKAEFKEAIKDYDEAIRLDSNFVDAYGMRGAAYCSLGEYEQGIKDYDEAIRLNPADAGAYCARGFVYSMLGKKAEATADYEKFITLTDDPEDIIQLREQIKRLPK